MIKAFEKFRCQVDFQKNASCLVKRLNDVYEILIF